MKKLTHQPREIKTLKDVQLEKYRVLREIEEIKHNFRNDRSRFLQGSFFDSMHSGMEFTSNLGRWLLSYKVALKAFKWIRGKMGKKNKTRQ